MFSSDPLRLRLGGVYHFPRSSSVYAGYATDVTFPCEEGTKMSRRFLLVLSLSFVISALAPPSFKAQSGPMRWKDNHVPVRLLPGYKITGYAGFEGDIHGKIWKDGGPTIEYSLVDLYAGDTAGTIPKDQQLWREEQTVGPNHFVCVYTRSNELVVTFSQRAIANFRAKIRDHKDLAEVLLIVLTLDVQNGYELDPSMIIDPQKPKH